MSSNQENVKDDINKSSKSWTPAYVSAENKSSAESKKLEEFKAIQNIIESSFNFIKKPTGEETTDIIYPLTPLLRMNDGTLLKEEDIGIRFYGIRKWNQDIHSSMPCQVISISPQTGNKVEVYDYDASQNEATQNTQAYSVTFTEHGPMILPAKVGRWLGQ